MFSFKFALSLAALSIGAQHFPSDGELLELIQTRVEEGRATGIVVGLLEADGTRRIVAFGDAGPGAEPLSAKSVFEIGSITKAFTGVLLADMVADGLLKEEDEVVKYLPDGVKLPVRAGRAIRLVDLATHRSGLPRLPFDFAPTDPSNPYADYTHERLFQFLASYARMVDVQVEFVVEGERVTALIFSNKGAQQRAQRLAD